MEYIGYFILFCCVILTIYKTSILFKYKLFGNTVIGTIVKRESISDTDNGYFYVIYQYEVDNKKYQNKTKKIYTDNCFETGNEIEVVYLKDNPEKAKYNNHMEFLGYETFITTSIFLINMSFTGVATMILNSIIETVKSFLSLFLNSV